jgi:hypothetical protein
VWRTLWPSGRQVDHRRRGEMLEDEERGRVGADQPVGRPRAIGDHARCAGAQLWMRRVQESRPPVSSSQLMTA